MKIDDFRRVCALLFLAIWIVLAAGQLFGSDPALALLDQIIDWIPGHPMPEASCYFTWVENDSSFYCSSVHLSEQVRFISATGTENRIQRTFLRTRGVSLGSMVLYLGEPEAVRRWRYTRLFTFSNGYVSADWGYWDAEVRYVILMDKK